MFTSNYKSFHLVVKINGISRESFVIDTGSHHTILSKKVWKRIGQPALSPSKIDLQAASGTYIPIKGIALVKVSFCGRDFELSVLVTDDNHTPKLLGRLWMHYMNVDWNAIFQTKKSILHCCHDNLYVKNCKYLQPEPLAVACSSLLSDISHHHRLKFLLKSMESFARRFWILAALPQ